MRKMEQHVHKKNSPCPSYYIATALPKCSYLPPAMEHLLFYGQSNILPIISRMLSLWSVKFIHLCLPNLCLPSYSPVSVLCLQQTGYISTRPYFVLGSWIRTATDANMVDPLIMSGVFFSNLYSFSMVWLFFLLNNGSIVDVLLQMHVLIGALCIVSSWWDSRTTSFLAKSSCSPHCAWTNKL